MKPEDYRLLVYLFRAHQFVVHQLLFTFLLVIRSVMKQRATQAVALWMISYKSDYNTFY